MTADNIAAHAAERIVLAAAIELGGDTATELLDLAAPSDFVSMRHEVLARIILGMAARDAAIDPITVSDAIIQEGKPDLLDPGYPFDLMSEAVVMQSAMFHAGTVHDKAIKRRLKNAGAAVAEIADGAGEAADLVEAARAAVDAVSVDVATVRAGIGDTLHDMLNGLSVPPSYIPSPWWELNEVIGGVRRSALTLIAARPAVGKTVVALQLATELARYGHVAYVSLEMPERELQMRLLSQTASVNMRSITTHDITDGERAKLSAAADALAATTLYVDDRAGVTMQGVRSFARSVARRAERDGRKFAGIVIDHLGLLRAEQRAESRQQEVANISRDLKVLAMSMDAPVIALSQLNRDAKGRKDQRPVITDLRDSGSLEQDADLVLMLHREVGLDPDAASTLEISVAKNRHGAAGDRIDLAFHGHFSRAVDMKYDPHADPTLVGL